LVQLYRYRQVSTPLERQQTKWVVFGYAVPVTINVTGTLLTLVPVLAARGALSLFAVNEMGFLLTIFPPLAFGVAILRYRLWDIDLVINRTLVYGTLTVSVIGLYMLVVVGLGSLIQLGGNLLLSLLATGLIAVLFQPARVRLQQGVNHVLYGERDGTCPRPYPPRSPPGGNSDPRGSTPSDCRNGRPGAETAGGGDYLAYSRG